MYPYVETICIDEGKAENIRYHNRRMNLTRRERWGHADALRLEEVLTDLPRQAGRIKGRILYGSEGIGEITFEPYEMRPVRSLKLVECDDIDYHLKSTDRSRLNELRSRRGTCDDIIIVKEGLLTDTSYANIALFDGLVWVTPRRPLLEGTRRASLLDSGLLTEAELSPADLPRFSRIALINAMIKLGELVLPTSAVE